VASLNEADFVLRSMKRAEYAVDPISRVTEYDADIPSVEALDQEVTDCLGHGSPSMTGPLMGWLNQQYQVMSNH
jgi:hypothetical protein